MNTRKLKIIVTSFALLAVSVAALRATPAGAQTLHGGRDKVSADLRQRLSQGGKVSVVIKSAGGWNRTLDDAVKSNGGAVTKAFASFPLRAASLPASAVESFAARPDVAHVALDREVKLLGHVSLTTGADAARVLANYSPTYDGAGIGIAVLDSGLDPNHTAFTFESGSTTRITYSKDFTGEGTNADPYGHGSHVASIAAGNGQVSNGAYRGVAPAAKIVNLRVLNSQGRGTISGLLSALDWVLTNRAAYNIRVVNLSLGTVAVDSYRDDPLCLAVRGLVDAGVVVVAAAGNEGRDGAGNKVYGQIHSPGNDPSVITVGAANTFGTDARNDDVVTTYSSRGPTRSFRTDSLGVKHYDNLIKPDLVAPGNKIVDAQSAGNLLVSQNPTLDANVSGSSARDQMYLNGTSMAAPVVAGAAALMLQANPKLTPNLVKALLMYTAQPLAGFNHFEQGAGLVNIEGAVRLARLVRTDLSSSTPVGSPLLTAPAPAPQTTIGGWTFTWGQGIVLDQTFASGTNLVTKYQAVYGLGVLLSDGSLLSDGTLISDGALMTDGVVLGDHILVSNGVLLGDGSPFLSCGVLLGDGVVLGDGSLLSDGVVLGDGALIGDGSLMSDIHVQAARALIQGDDTASMAAVAEVGLPPSAPGGLKASAASKTQINLTWADNSSDETGFHVERSTDGVMFTQVATVGAGARSYASAGLTGGKKYFHRVRAYNAHGNSAYTAAVATTTPTK